MIPRRAWLLPGRRQALALAALILVGGASLLLLPEPSSSYRAVATAVTPDDGLDCVEAAPEHVADDEVRERVARRARVPEREVAGATEVTVTPGGGVLAVAFEADTAYAAQRGAYTTVSESVRAACESVVSGVLTDVATASTGLADAEAALAVAPLPPPPVLVAARDQAVQDERAALASFDRVVALESGSSSVDAATPSGTQSSGLEELAAPAGVVVCAALAGAVLRTGWRRAAAPTPA